MNRNFHFKISHNLAVKAQKLIADLGFNKNHKKIFISDEQIWQNCKKFFAKDFLEFFDEVLLLKNPQADEKYLKKILSKAKSHNLIVGLGSGTINDLCKMASAQQNISYIIFASAASMNGYFSKNASITINGHKKTLPATLPKSVFCDLEILSNAPIALTKAGIGDAMCFYSCWFDWYLSHQIFETKFDEKPFKILQKQMNYFVKNFAKFSIKDESFLKILIEILLLSGQGMTIAGGSYPASQSEHLIAHCLTMKYAKETKNILHGQQIAITTLTSAKLQKKLLAAKKLQFKQDDFDLKKLQNFFGKKIAKECEAEVLQKKLSASELKEVNENLAKNWEKFSQKLQKIYFDETHLKEIFSHFKIKTLPAIFGISKKEYEEATSYAKFIRNRITCLDFFDL